MRNLCRTDAEFTLNMYATKANIKQFLFEQALISWFWIQVDDNCNACDNYPTRRQICQQDLRNVDFGRLVASQSPVIANDLNNYHPPIERDSPTETIKLILLITWFPFGRKLLSMKWKCLMWLIFNIIMHIKWTFALYQHASINYEISFANHSMFCFKKFKRSVHFEPGIRLNAH